MATHHPKPDSAKRALLKQLAKKRRPPRNKHHARGERVDGIWFPSQAEIVRYHELMLMVISGKISKLKVHERFPLFGQGGYLIGYYEADFTYTDFQKKRVVEDVKGQRLPLYIWKKKHFEADYPWPITEIGVKHGRSFVIPPKPTRNRRIP